MSRYMRLQFSFHKISHNFLLINYKSTILQKYYADFKQLKTDSRNRIYTQSAWVCIYRIKYITKIFKKYRVNNIYTETK
jgi:hypothetical protein